MKTMIIFLLIFSLIVWLTKSLLFRLVSWLLNWENYRRILRMHLALISASRAKNKKEDVEHLEKIRENVSALEKTAVHPDEHKCSCGCIIRQFGAWRKAVAFGRIIKN